MSDLILHLRAGESVEVKTEEEIRSTLDTDGMFESVPFMPEMRKFCGKHFRVSKRADKICSEAAYMRIMNDAVFLENVRCDGGDHDGCKRMCLIFWKEAWLRRTPDDAVPETIPYEPVMKQSELPPIQPGKKYVCQSTEVLKGSTHLSAWDPKQYIRDIQNNNFTFFEILQYLYNFIWNRFYYFLGKPEYGKILGENTKTPAAVLNLQPGELVIVKSRDEIVATLDKVGNNRGLSIDMEMLWYCDRRFRVLTRIDRMILEKTGEMREIKNSVLLQDVSCTGLCRRGCTRGSYPMWREVWLKRVEENRKVDILRLGSKESNRTNFSEAAGCVCL